MKIQTLLILFIWFFLLLNFSHSERYITKGPAPGEIYFFIPFENYNTGLALCHSWDYGATYTIVDSTSDISRITADADSGGIYYVANGGGLYYSSNYGYNFNFRSGGQSSSFTSGLIPGVIYKLAMGIRRSEDYGANFSFMGNSPGGQINLGNLLGEIYTIYESQGKLFFSSDSGKNFILVNDSLPSSPIPDVINIRHGANTGEVFMLNNNSQELFYSNDSVKTFNLHYQFNLQPTNEWFLGMVGSHQQGEVIVSAFRYFPLTLEGEFYIYHSTDYGATWSSYHHLTTIDDKTSNPIKTFYLSQNYPNPFNGETQIEFYLPTSCYTEIFIYDIEGKIIKTLVSKKLPAGNHSTNWAGINNNGKAVASGVYFYKFETPDFKQTKKMFYIR